ncbi:hypothetical protein BRD07_02635 [Halobacteriales archaeon QS_9_68_42]|nr:MAG: hypothetical protein BRD07_02635 [Halobacteriales archaeon QS_9_68_42]
MDGRVDVGRPSDGAGSTGSGYGRRGGNRRECDAMGMSNETDPGDDGSDSAEEAYVALDAEWRCVGVNAAGARFLGAPEEKLYGSSLREAAPALVGTPFEEALRTAIGNDDPGTADGYLADRDAWYELRAYPDDGGVSAYFRDVTARRERRRELEAYEARFEALTGSTEQVVLTMDDDRTVQYVNEAVEDLFGYEPEELVGESLLELVPERFHEAHGATVDHYLETGDKSLEWEWIELPGRHRDGHEMSLGISFGETVVGDEHRFTAVMRDISERKRRQQEREADIEFLRNLYEVTTNTDLTLEDKIDRTLALGCERLDLPYGFLTRIRTDDDGDGRQVMVYTRGDHPMIQPGESCPLSEAYCRETIEPDGFQAIPDTVAAGWGGDPAQERFGLGAYIGGKVVVDDELYGTLCFASEEPRERPFSEAGRMLVRVVSRWVSYELERHRQQTDLQHTNDRLEGFASVVSHDLRNPLTVAKGHLELAREKHDDEDLAAVDGALNRMETLIEDLLTLAQEGEAVTDLEDVRFGELCEDCWRTVRTAGATLRVESTGEIRADPDRLKQLLENLFRNAVKHGSTSPPSHAREDAVKHGFTGSRPEADDAVEHGSTSPPSQARENAGSENASEPSVADAPEDTVEHSSTSSRPEADDAVEHGSTDSEDGEPEVTITVGDLEDGFYVADDGSGIPEADRETVFESGFSTSEEGTGFGLAIVEEIATGHGWEIRATESEAGGARFEITGVDRP